MLHTTFAKPVEPAGVVPVNALPAGTRLQEFEVRSVIGEGGFGIVYRAFDTALEREVAIKEYLPVSHASRRGDGTVVASSERQRETFEKGLSCFVSEARMLARFKHRALVEILRFWEEKGTAYMVMPYYEGRPLSQLVQQGFRIQDTEAMLSFLSPLLDGLAMLHATDCYHRDISTDNILILEDGSPLLLDFGAARRILVDESEVLTIILKPGFAPIEQYSDDHELAPQGAWTDLYALAAVAYQLVTGSMPMVSVGRIIRDPLVPLAARAPKGLAPGLVAAIDAGLRVSPDQRPQSVQAFLDIIASDASGNLPQRAGCGPGQSVDPLAFLGVIAIEDPPASDTDFERYGGQGDSTGSPRYLDKHLVGTVEDEALAPKCNSDAQFLISRRRATGLAPVLSVLVLLGLGLHGLIGGEAKVTIEPESGPAGVQQLEPVWSPTATDVQGALDAERGTEAEAAVGVETVQTPIERAEGNAAPETVPVPEAIRPGVVDIRVEPWGNVFVNGELAGVAPPRVRFEAQPGQIQVEIRNETHAPRHITIDVEAGRAYRIRHEFGKD